MPDKPLTVFTYAASASLATIALVYFFHPTYLFDSDSSTSNASSRKKGIVGLYNPANDCFINSNLQSLAGLGDLRTYLIREIHRRDLGGAEVYDVVPEKDAKGKEVNARKLRSLQNGEVTRGLKDMIDRLNERPLYRKTIAATSFVRALESAFGTTISKAQQDAQELLQIVTERLSEEYHAGKEARTRAKQVSVDVGGHSQENEALEEEPANESIQPAELSEQASEKEDGFPLEGQTQARVECEFCHFVPRAKPMSFVMLNLMVPQKPSASLNDCFDGHFKTEYIEDYMCDKCRLTHAVEALRKQLRTAKTAEQTTNIESDIRSLEKALAEDPEKPPEGVALPDNKLAPKRKISRHIEMKAFPKVLVIHLSRSIYDPRNTSTKNLAKVDFPERLPLGGILNRRNYKLLGVVTHKGTHNSGHYETFRRQHYYAPYSNPHADRATGPYVAAPTSVPSPTPGLALRPASNSEKHTSSATYGSSEESALSSSPRTSGSHSTQPSSIPDDIGGGDARDASMSQASPSSPTTTKKSGSKSKHRSSPSAATVQSKASSITDMSRLKKRKKPIDRWWRISDDKIKECKTAEVLSMTREVYLLFYEMERNADESDVK